MPPDAQKNEMTSREKMPTLRYAGASCPSAASALPIADGGSSSSSSIAISMGQLVNDRFTKLVLTMADRVTQFHDTLSVLAGQFCDSIGVIHTEHERYNIAEAEQISQQIVKYTQQFADCINTSCGNIDILINSLPTLKASSDAQFGALAKLESQNEEAAQALLQAVQKAENKLADIRASLKELSDAHYNISSQPALDSMDTS